MNKLALRAMLVCLWVFPCARSAWAQADTTFAREQVERAARDPSLRSGLRLPLPTLNLTATTTDKEVRGQLGIPTGTPSIVANLTLTAPVDNAAPGGRTTVADRDGLSHKASVQGGIFFYRWQPRPDTTRENAVCQAAKNTVAEFNKHKPINEKIDTSAYDFCSTTGKMPPAFKRQMRDAVRWGVPISLALNGGWGHDAFKWVEPTTLRQNKAEHENLQIRFSAATFYPPIGFLVAQYTRQRLFEAAATTQLCIPRGGAGALTCSTTAISEPTKADDDLITGELRHFFGQRLASGVVITRNITQNATALEVPFYFIPNADGKLNGGISALWSTDDRSFRMVAFIGTVFKALYEKPH